MFLILVVVKIRITPALSPKDSAGENTWECNLNCCWGPSQSDSPHFSGVNKVLTIDIVT